MDINTPAPKRILVSGATGNQGGGVVKALAQANSLLPVGTPDAFTILAVTRDAKSPKAQRLLSLRGVELIQGDLTDSAALFKAAGAVDGVYSVQPGQGEGGLVGEERKQAKGLADAAKAAGVQHFVYASVDFGGLDDTKIVFFEIKREMEAYIQSLGLPYTFLRPTGLMDSFLNEDSPGSQAYSTIMTRQTFSSPETQTLQLVCCGDIGKVAAHVFAHQDEYLGKAVSLAGDEVTLFDFLDTYKRIAGRDLPTMSNLLVGRPMLRMCEFLDEHGFTADLSVAREMVPEMKTWAQSVETEMVKK